MDTEERTSTKTKKKMDLEGLSVICSDLGEPEEDGDGKRIGYSKSDYCLGKFNLNFPFLANEI